MAAILKTALIGDYNSEVIAHQAAPKALQIAAKHNQLTLQYDWIYTMALKGDLDEKLSDYHGIWAVPASPYENTAGALAAIKYACENNVPFLGTCGGYQHTILEYVHNVLDMPEADNTEVNADTKFPLINALVCALVEKSGAINLQENTKISGIYGAEVITEKYHCSYGFNREYLHLFEDSDLIVSAYDSDGDPRCIELVRHPFFIGTAFQPERSALSNQSHPLINQFVLTMSKV